MTDRVSATVTTSYASRLRLLYSTAPVIPVLIRNSTMPNRAELPDSIAKLADHMAQPLRNDSFPEHYKRLKKAIDIRLKSPTYARVLSVLAGLLLVSAGQVSGRWSGPD
jgi:hypothetical protein